MLTLEQMIMMCISSINKRRILALALTFSALSAYSATLSDLYNSVPRPPSDAATALTWVQDGKIVQPDFVEIDTAIAALRAKIAELNGGETPPARIAVPASLADSAVVQAAAASYSDYLAMNEDDKAPQAVLGKRKRWIQAAFGRTQMSISEKMTTCATPCTDEAILAANEPLTRARDQELKTEIRGWNAMFDDWKKKRFGVVMTADSRVAATAEGGAATTAQGRSIMASYQAAILDEVELLLSISKLAVLRADAIMAGLDGTEPDGISGATKKKSAK